LYIIEPLRQSKSIPSSELEPELELELIPELSSISSLSTQSGRAFEKKTI